MFFQEMVSPHSKVKPVTVTLIRKQGCEGLTCSIYALWAEWKRIILCTRMLISKKIIIILTIFHPEHRDQAGHGSYISGYLVCLGWFRRGFGNVRQMAEQPPNSSFHVWVSEIPFSLSFLSLHLLGEGVALLLPQFSPEQSSNWKHLFSLSKMDLSPMS